MPIKYRVSGLSIKNFRGINSLNLTFEEKSLSILIGANNAGKSSIISAIALALNGGGSHKWGFSERDFFCSQDGERASNFEIRVEFSASDPMELPAVKAVGNPVLVHGALVRGRIQKNGVVKVSRMLCDANGAPISLSTRTPFSDKEKEKWTDHDVNYRRVNARINDIFDESPEVWLFTPQNIDASLYIWKTGPLAKLTRHLVKRFLSDSWELELENGQTRKMPNTLHAAYAFFGRAVREFPFWKDDMKPQVESVFRKYVGDHAQMDLRPDTLSFEDWLAQKLAIDLATDPSSVPVPLQDMGDGWQSVIRLAALEALAQYPELVRERVVLLVEEPETHLHPHLRRRMRQVLGELAQSGWFVLVSTHSAELVSLSDFQQLTRVVREKGAVIAKSSSTNSFKDSARLQSKIDGAGANEFLFGNAAIFCEGQDDRVAIREALGKLGVDLDASSISVIQANSVNTIPAFAEIASELGIRWCAVSDEDIGDNGKVKDNTAKARAQLQEIRTDRDLEVIWKGNLEKCLNIAEGKATPSKTITLLEDSSWGSSYPNFIASIQKIAEWIESGV